MMIYFQCTYAQDSAWIRNNYYKIERYINVRDGTKLFTSIYIPKDSTEPHPILMTRTPYSCAPYGEDKWRPWWKRFQKAYFKEGYIMVPKMKIEIIQQKINTRVKLNTVIAKYIKLYSEMSDEYDKDSQHGEKFERQQFWNTNIMNQLKALEGVTLDIPNY
jgi:X-Pro dipeptidyl-peptidase (S15 family)